MARRRGGVARLAIVTVMAVLGGTACGRYGPPVRDPEVHEPPASAIDEAATTAGPAATSDDDESRPRVPASTPDQSPDPTPQP